MPLFDTERVDALFAVLGETGGRRLLETFADQLSAEMHDLVDVVMQGDLCETERHAHGLKGAAANFGATRLQMASRKVEQAAHSQAASARIARLLADLDRVAQQTSRAARQL